MKSFICAIVIFISIFIGSGYYTHLLSKEVQDMQNYLSDVVSCLKEDDWESCNKKTEIMMQEWGKTQKWLKAIVNHNEIDLILQTISEMKGYIDVKNKNDALAKAEVLTVLLNHIPENEALTVMNIL